MGLVVPAREELLSHLADGIVSRDEAGSGAYETALVLVGVRREGSH